MLSQSQKDKNYDFILWVVKLKTVDQWLLGPRGRGKGSRLISILSALQDKTSFGLISQQCECNTTTE